MDDDKLTTFLLGSHGRTTDEERLSGLGKRAAAQYLQKGVKLSSAVSSLVADGELNRDQIRRVCEIANQETFRQLFDSSPDKNVSFPLANFAEVVAPVQKTAERFGRSSYAGRSYNPPAGQTDLLDGREKVASADPIPYEQPYGELERTWQQLRGLREIQLSKLAGMEFQLLDLQEKLHESVQQSVEEGSPLAEVLRALGPLATSGSFFRKTAESLVEKLLESGRANKRSLLEGLDKTAAQRCPNPEHPTVSTFCALQQLHEQQRLEKCCLDVVNEQLLHVSQALGVSE